MSIGKPLVDEWSGVVDVLLLLLSFFNIFTYAKLTSSKRLVDGMITYSMYLVAILSLVLLQYLSYL